MMPDILTVQFSLSVDTILNIIGGAMLVVTGVVVTIMGIVKCQCQVIFNYLLSLYQ